MARNSVTRLGLVSVYVVLLLLSPALLRGSSIGASGSQLNLSVSPSAVVIKVGGNASVSLTFTTDETLRLVCFSEEDFPSSGFILTFLPQCTITPANKQATTTQLIVEATPAAAPQNFTALIQASIGNQTASAPLTITVVPAIPAWIPWLGILLFFLVIGAALFVKPRKSKKKGKGKMSG